MSTAAAPSEGHTYASHRQVMAVLPGLLLAMLLAMLDNLIVGTAMPRIVGDLGGVEHLSWVVTAYVLTMTVSTPLYGKLGDLYGRKRLFSFAIVVFLLGSALSGLSQTMGQLIGFRALQGLGAGGLIVGVMAIIGDLISPRERGKYQGYMSAVMGIATIGGPLIGGLLTDHLSWRWVFYVNLPLGVIALAVIVVGLRLPRHTVKHKIDYLGALMLTVAAGSLVLLTTWGGTEYDWGSWQIVGLGVVGVLATGLFALIERRAVEPVLPLRLFGDRNFTTSTLLGFLAGFAMFGAVTFLPMFQQTVQQASATNSGLLLLPMMVPMLVVSPLVGILITRTGRYRIFPILGGALLVVGIALMTQLDVDTSELTTGAYMVVLGIGMALLIQTSMLIVQNSVEPKDMGVASSTSMFFRSIGGSFGVSLAGAVFGARLTDSLAGVSGAGQLSGSANIDPERLGDIPPAALGPLFEAIAHATQGVFWWALPFAVLAFAAALLVKEVPLRGSPTPPEQQPAAAKN